MKKTKILFIQPPFKNNLNHVKLSAVVRPMGILYLAAYLRKYAKNVEVRILDAHAWNMSTKKTIDEISKEKWDIINISYWTSQALQAFDISKEIKKQFKDTLLLHGGIHASQSPEEAVDYCDYVIISEGEKTMLQIVDKIQQNKDFSKTDGIAFKKNGKLAVNPQRDFIKDLDTIPFPAYDLINLKLYNTGACENEMHVIGGEMLPIMGSRGCPYNCSFCSSPMMWRQKVRYRTVGNVIEEIKWAIEKFGINKFHFWDDNFMLIDKWVRELCNEIIKRKLNIYWTGLTRAEHIIKYKKTLPLMKKAGCVGIEIGVESANPETFEKVQKGQTLEETRKAIQLQKDARMVPLFTSMSFNVGETLDGYYVQNEFLNQVFTGNKYSRIYIGQFATPHPKTMFNLQAREEGLILAENWNDYTHFEINFVPNSVLNEVPVKNRGSVRPEDYLFVIRGQIDARYDEFPLTESKITRLKKIMLHIKMTKYFYSLCNGNNTVLQIGKKISKKYNISFKRAIQFAAFVTTTFGQSGMIKSKNSKIKDLHVKSLVNVHYLKHFVKSAINLVRIKLAK